MDGDSFVGLKASAGDNELEVIAETIAARADGKEDKPSNHQELHADDLVWEKMDKPGDSTLKFSPSWKGPNFVLGLLSKVLYWIRPLHDEGPIRRVHVADLANC